MRHFSLILFLAVAFGALPGCSDYHRDERPPWRAQAEEACIARGAVAESASVRPFHELSGPGICGALHPFKVSALDGGSVALDTTQTLDCPMVAALDAWVREVVQPAARARFGERVVRIDSMGSYNCRGINNRSGAGLSEHSFANAIDIGGFVLESGRTLDITHGFNGPDVEVRAFLHDAHAGACSHFTTVLGPGYNIFHYNHFHMDLALHGSTSRGPRRICKPVPGSSLPEPPAKDAMPDPPAIDEEMDIARAPLPAPSLRSGPPTLVANVPPPPAPRPRPTVSASAPPAAAPGFDPAQPEPARRAPRPAARDAAGERPLISFGAAEPRGPGPALGLAPLPDAEGPDGFAPRPRPRVASHPPAPVGVDRRPSEPRPVPGDASDAFDITSSIGPARAPDANEPAPAE